MRNRRAFCVELILCRRINSRRRGRRKKAEIVPTNLRSHVINSGVCVLAGHGYIDIIVYTNRKWPVCTAMIAMIRYRYDVFNLLKDGFIEIYGNSLFQLSFQLYLYSKYICIIVKVGGKN